MSENQTRETFKAHQLETYLRKIGKQEQDPNEIENDQYVELHFHSEYSSLDGAIRISDIAKAVEENGQVAVAVTDHGTMSGLFDIHKECKKHNIKLIPAVEFYIVDDATQKYIPPKKRRKKQEEEDQDQEETEGKVDQEKTYTSPDWESHIVLIAKNKEGYRNLLQLHYLGYLHRRVNAYGRVVPRIDLSLLEKYKEGIIVGTACLGGQISQAIIREAGDLAEQLVIKYKQTFGDNLFLEVQPVAVQDFEKLEYRQNVIEQTEKLQALVNQKVVDLALKHNVMLVCTTDAHYARKEDKETHALLLAIQSKKDITDENCFYFPACPLQTAKQMAEQFPIEWIKNSRKIADLCDEPDYLDFGEDYKIPSFPIPKDSKFEEWRRGLCQ